MNTNDRNGWMERYPSQTVVFKQFKDFQVYGHLLQKTEYFQKLVWKLLGAWKESKLFRKVISESSNFRKYLK